MHLVYVRWCDPHGREGGWLSLDEMGDGTELIAESVGWLVKESKKSVTIVPHVIRGRGAQGYDDKGAGEMTIPRKAIEKMKRVKL